MYLEKLIDENIGPIDNLTVEFPFTNEGMPKPVIFVGENGSGKSTALSNIVDALYTIASENYDNVLLKSDVGDGRQYYKAISPVEIKTGKEYMFSYLKFKNEVDISYLFKSGEIDDNLLNNKISDRFSTGKKTNYKSLKSRIAAENDPFVNNVFVYFGPDRYEKPYWMGEKYYSQEDHLHLSIIDKWDRKLNNPITVKNVTDTNLQWLIDVIADSRPDIETVNNQKQIVHTNLYHLQVALSVRNTLEKIMSEIIGEEVYFALNYRNVGHARFSIVAKNGNKIVAPTLDSLSAGQLALFNMFSTIVRYSDRNNQALIINAEQIKGIVVIDEIELHLHSTLQREILPNLLKLFPGIQFIITSHSPLFLLGMESTFGNNNYMIIDMPIGKKIDCEMFSEFQKAYDYLKKTNTYQSEIKNTIADLAKYDKPLIITEGTTDWIHLETAFDVLSKMPQYKCIFEGLNITFYEYYPKDSKDDTVKKLDMGNRTLSIICENHSKVPNEGKFIFIADRDDKQTNSKLAVDGAPYKDWGNNVYSLTLPIPGFRENNPDICIEHLYPDSDIKTEIEVNGVMRRLFIGNEFDTRGIALDIGRFCENKHKCGPNSIAIIDGEDGEKVTSINNDGCNYAVSKMVFAEYVKNHREKFHFDGFVELFRIIRSIVFSQE